MIELTIMGEPLPQTRPRYDGRGKFVRVYYADKFLDYRKSVATQAAKQYKGDPLCGPLRIDVTIFRPMQKSGSKVVHAKKLSGLIRPVEKGDVDNYFKSVTDPLTGLIWVDDAQIVEAHISKFYSTDPRVEIKVEEI